MYVQCRSSEGGGSEGGRYGVQVNGGGRRRMARDFLFFFQSTHLFKGPHVIASGV